MRTAAAAMGCVQRKACRRTRSRMRSAACINPPPKTTISGSSTLIEFSDSSGQVVRGLEQGVQGFRIARAGGGGHGFGGRHSRTARHRGTGGFGFPSAAGAVCVLPGIAGQHPARRSGRAMSALHYAAIGHNAYSNSGTHRHENHVSQPDGRAAPLLREHAGRPVAASRDGHAKPLAQGVAQRMKLPAPQVRGPGHPRRLIVDAGDDHAHSRGAPGKGGGDLLDAGLKGAGRG